MVLRQRFISFGQGRGIEKEKFKWSERSQWDHNILAGKKVGAVATLRPHG